jgi:hypothetical protein
VIGDGSLGEVPHFRFLGRIGVEAAGRGGYPHHVEPDAQHILDVGNLLPGVRMETGELFSCPVEGSVFEVGVRGFEVTVYCRESVK